MKLGIPFNEALTAWREKVTSWTLKYPVKGSANVVAVLGQRPSDVTTTEDRPSDVTTTEDRPSDVTSKVVQFHSYHVYSHTVASLAIL